MTTDLTSTLTASSQQLWLLPITDKMSVTATGIEQHVTNFARQIGLYQCETVMKDLTQRITGLHVVDPEIEPPTDKTIKKAIEWIGRMFNAATSIETAWKNPLVSGNFDGQVVFEWWGTKRKLTVRIGEDETEALRMWGEYPAVFDEDIFVERYVDLTQVWRWLCSNG